MLIDGFLRVLCLKKQLYKKTMFVRSENFYKICYSMSVKPQMVDCLWQSLSILLNCFTYMYMYDMNTTWGILILPYFSTRLLFMKSERVLGSVMKLIVLSNVTICKETETYASLTLIQINTVHNDDFILTVFNIFIVKVHTTFIHRACTCISSLFKYSF